MYVACMGKKRNGYQHKLLNEVPEGRRTVGRPERKLEDNIKVHLKEIGFEGVDCINWLSIDLVAALVNAVMNLTVP